MFLTLNKDCNKRTSKKEQNSKRPVNPIGDSLRLSKIREVTKRKMRTSMLGKKINKIKAPTKKKGKAKSVVSKKRANRIMKKSEYFKAILLY